VLQMSLALALGWLYWSATTKGKLARRVPKVHG
jgi:hypothetical protein